MKSKILFPIIVLLFPGFLFSQKIWFGPKTGLNIIPVENTELKGNAYSLGFQAGAAFEYQFNGWFSFSTNPLYSAQRKEYEINETSSFFESISALTSFLPDTLITSYIESASQYVNDTVYSKTKGFLKLGYAELPLMAKFRYSGFSFSSGPYLAILVSNNATEEFTQYIPILKTIEPSLDTIPLLHQLVVSMFPGSENPVITSNIKSSNVKMFDYGFIADLSYQANSNLTFGIRYTRGIPNYRSPELSKDDYLSSMTLSVGYLINVKKKGEIDNASPQFQ